MDGSEFATIFAGYQHDSGATVVLGDPIDATTGPLIKGSVRGPITGSFEFRSRLNLDDQWVIWLEDIKIADGRGSGLNFGRDFLRWAEARYRGFGVEWIEIEARGRGCYVWANLDYRLRDGYTYPLEREREVEVLRELCLHSPVPKCLLREKFVDAKLLDELWRLLDPSAAGALTTPAELARFGWAWRWTTRGQDSWLGRELLLAADWSDHWLGWKPAP